MPCRRCAGPTPDGRRECAACAQPERPYGHRAAAVCVVVTILIAVQALLYLEETTGRTAGVLVSTPASTPSTTVTPVFTSQVHEPVAEPDFAAVYADVSTGVVPIRAVTCLEGGTGTGFLLDERTVVTAAHVVEGAVAVSVQVSGEPMPARVAALDTSLDLAVLDLGHSAPGAVLPLAPTDPAYGDSVAILGYPEGGPLRMTEGTILDPYAFAVIEGRSQPGLVETDASARPGNSGGPLVNPDGEVAGVVIAGSRTADGPTYAVPATTVARALPTLPAPTSVVCEQPPLGPPGADVAGLPEEQLIGADIARTFGDYFGGINSGDFALAYDQLSPRLRGDFSSFAEGLVSTYDYQFEVRDVWFGVDSVHVWLEFVSLQDPALGPDGQSCTEWSVDYTLIPSSDGRYLIDRAQSHNGGPAHHPCGGW